jgi:hypothetical protein
LIVFPASEIGVNLFGFQPFHRCLLDGSATMVGDRKSEFKLKFKEKSEKKVRG